MNRLKVYFTLTLFILMIGLVLGLGSKLSFSALFDPNTIEYIILWTQRFPRVIAVALVGAYLALAGALVQGLSRNPLAEPSLLGISQSSTFLIFVLILIKIPLTSLTVTSASLVGAFASVMALSSLLIKPQKYTVIHILLLGSALGGFMMSMSTVLGLLSNQAQNLAYYLMGGFRFVQMSDLIMLLFFGLPSVLYALKRSSDLTILNCLGDEAAYALGINIKTLKLVTLILVAILVGISTAVGKNIAFVGLIIPSMLRILFKNNYKYILPFSLVLGAILLSFADVLAKSMIYPYEMPIGVFTSILGIPFFLYLAKKEKVS